MRALSTTLLLLGLCVGLAPSLRATTSFNFSSATQNAGVGFIGNSLSFSPAGLNVTAYAFSTTGTSGTLAQAALGQYYSSFTPLGLGVCAGGGVDYTGAISNCTSPNHAIDNVGAVDFVLLQLSVPLSSISLTLSPFGSTHDMDATYFTGNCTGTCTAASFLTNILGKADTTAGLSAITGVTGVSTGSFTSVTTGSSSLQTFSLTGIPSSGVNWVLIGANTTNADGIADYFKLNAMSFTPGPTVPEPATFGLAGFALAALGLLRRKKRSATV